MEIKQVKEKIVNQIIKDPKTRDGCLQKLRSLWEKGIGTQKCTTDDKKTYLHKNGLYDIKEFPEELFLNDFCAFIASDDREINKAFQKYLTLAATPEASSALERLFSNCYTIFLTHEIKEETRKTPGTLSNLYRSLQRFASKYRREQIYDEKWFGYKGLLKEDLPFFKSKFDELEKLIQEALGLPNKAPTKAEIYCQAKLNAEPCLKLLDLYLDGVKAKYKLPLVSIRGFAWWFGKNYGLIIETENIGEQAEPNLPDLTITFEDEYENEVDREVCHGWALTVYNKMSVKMRRQILTFSSDKQAQKFSETIDLDPESLYPGDPNDLPSFLYFCMQLIPEMDETNIGLVRLFIEELGVIASEKNAPKMSPSA